MKFVKLLLLSITIIFFAWTSPLQAVSLAQLPPSAQIREITSLTNSQDVLTVATFNVENLDPSDDNRFDGIARIIVENLRAPDVIALDEIQDNNGNVNDRVVNANLTYEELITAINNTSGPEYDFVDIAPRDDQDGGEPGGNIRVGFLFQPNRVSLARLPKGGSSDAVAVLQGSDGLDLSLNPGRIDPQNDAFNDSRKPLAAEFLFNGQKLFIIANHFVSKLGGSPDDVKRLNQAEIVSQFVSELLQSEPDANVIVLGDLNDLPDSPPLETLKEELKNLPERLPRDEQYTFKFKGDLQLIDHLLVSDHLSRVAQPDVDIVHVNIGFRRSASDHDPVLAAFRLPASQFNSSTTRPTPSVSQFESVSNSATAPPQSSDTDLINQLAEEYKPSKNLNYDQARDQMFGVIDNQSGVVTDVYAGYSIRLTGSGDPSKEADSLGLNTEHVWPQSKGADSGNAQADLHHLFPARKDINTERGNKPFEDINDTSTKKWFRDDALLSSIPTREIDEFSESASSRFEPREEVKGDIARAMFYFYTIYRNQGDKKDPSYFGLQRETLCRWNRIDPPDNAEIERSHAIASFQGNDNPFVLDATLADRAYCS